MAQLQNVNERVAVICCFLDGKAFLAEAIESVRAQDYGDFALVLVDDGSTDGASEIARAFTARDPRISYLEHDGHANKGLSASRNAGIAASDGDYIAFIDADDVWVPHKLSEQMFDAAKRVYDKVKKLLKIIFIHTK